MEVLYCVEMEDGILPEWSRDGADGRASSRPLSTDRLHAGVAKQMSRPAERHTQLGLYLLDVLELRFSPWLANQGNRSMPALWVSYRIAMCCITEADVTYPLQGIPD